MQLPCAPDLDEGTRRSLDGTVARLSALLSADA